MRESLTLEQPQAARHKCAASRSSSCGTTLLPPYVLRRAGISLEVHGEKMRTALWRRPLWSPQRPSPAPTPRPPCVPRSQRGAAVPGVPRRTATRGGARSGQAQGGIDDVPEPHGFARHRQVRRCLRLGIAPRFVGSICPFLLPGADPLRDVARGRRVYGFGIDGIFAEASCGELDGMRPSSLAPAPVPRPSPQGTPAALPYCLRRRARAGGHGALGARRGRRGGALRRVQPAGQRKNAV